MAEQEPHAAQTTRTPEGVASRVPIWGLVRYYLWLAALGFGGPVALCGQMEKKLVGERKGLTREEMREAIAVCQSLPGPLAIQVGIFISYLRGLFWGAWAGGWAFILPNFVITSMQLTLRGLGVVSVCALGSVVGAHAAEIKIPEEVAVERFDFEQQGVEGWRLVAGQWVVEEMPGAPSGKRVLVQRATENPFNVLVASPGPYTDIDVSVRFKPMAGREDASGGIVFRFAEGHYYVVRANALENNFRLYYYDRGRHQLATAKVQPPTLGQWHTIRVVAVGDHMQAYLNGALLLDHRDSRYRAGQVGLWTKADSITAFDDLVIRGVPGS